MPLERTITNAVIAEARRMGWWARKIHGNAFQKGLPDVLCLRNGRAVWLEVKQPGCIPTPHQKATMHEIREQGGSPCFVVTSKQQAVEYLEAAVREGQ